MSSITFGSVGDIISVCLLVKDVVEALDQNRGSPAEYQALVRELGSLERALLEVDLLSRSHSQSADIIDICNTARQSVQDCRKALQTFSKKIKRYDAALGENGTKKLLHEVSMKIRWHIVEKEAVTKFRAETTAHANALNMLLATANVKLIQLNGSKLEELQSHAQTSNRQQDDRSSKILDKLEHANSSLLGAKTLLAKLSAGLDRLQQFSLELKDSVHRILSLNVSTYNAVVAIKSGLPSRLERALIGDPAILEDGLGRIAPVHLQFINSWDAFDAVLEVRFRGLDGHEKVRKRDFVLQEHATGFEIRRSRVWEGSILPGQRIEMSFVFSKDGPSASTAVDASCTSCPKCGFVCSEKQDSEVQCAKCNLIYKRIIEIEEMEATTSNAVPVGHRSQPRFGQNPFGPLPPPTTSASKRKREDGLDEEFARFKRVRLVSRRVKLRPRAIFGGSQRIRWPTLTSDLSSPLRGIFPPSATDNPGSLDGLRRSDAFRAHVPSPKFEDPDDYSSDDPDDTCSEAGVEADAFRTHVPPSKFVGPDDYSRDGGSDGPDDPCSEAGGDADPVPVLDIAARWRSALTPDEAARHLAVLEWLKGAQ